MKYQLYTDMALARDLPSHDLLRGDVVKLVEHHVAADGGEGYSIEVFNAVGGTVAVTTVEEAALEPLHSDEVLSVRRIKTAAA